MALHQSSSAPCSAALEEYKIANTTLFNPENVKLRIATIGAGISGIMMAYHAHKNLQNVDFVVYERNHDIGGTWLLNRYPGCACDIPSHAYTYSFALNPDWSHFFSSSAEIWSYLNRVVETWNLRRFMQFSTEVKSAHWQESSSTWLLQMIRRNADSSTTEFTDECDVLLHATGVLNNFTWPDIKGLENFKGKIIHTARWPEEYRQDNWRQDRVAVIGSGASSVQTVPTMQPFVKHMDVFVRTPVWFVDIAGNDGKNIEYTEDQKQCFRSQPNKLVEHAKFLENQVNSNWEMYIKGSPTQLAISEKFRKRTADIIKDAQLAESMTPKWSVGCRRITPGDPYMLAIQKPNVDVHFTEVVEITDNSVVGKNGIKKDVDTIICATGFDTSFRPAFPIVGRNGVDLSKKWAVAPEGYLGLAVPDMPNFFTFIGPSWPIGNGSVMGPLEAVGEYVVKFIQKLQNEMIKSFEPKQEITKYFNEHAQEYLKRTVWTDACRSWYKDAKTNRVNALWPGESLHYIETICNPRYEDFTFKYSNKNPWAYLGNGTTLATILPNGDRSPYISVEAIDEDWLRHSI